MTVSYETWKTLDERLDRIEAAIVTMASWLVQAQTGFAERDVKGIQQILEGTDEGVQS